jgi:hypothetical protein
MGFFTIFIAPGLSERDYKRALSAGSAEVSSRGRDHRELLTTAGFETIEQIDLTPEFRETARAWLDARERYAEELAAAEGEERFEERQRDNRAQLAAIEDGLLHRALFICA